MSTKTVSLTEEAYEKLKSMKEGKESFSDVVERISGKVDLTEYSGVLSEKAGEELEKNIRDSREEHGEKYRERSKKTVEELNDT